MKRFAYVSFLIFVWLATVNCASFGRKLKSFVGGGSSSSGSGAQGSGYHSTPTSFANQPNVMVGKERKYKRVNKDNFADDQALEENSGSLWRREGQGSY